MRKCLSVILVITVLLLAGCDKTDSDTSLTDDTPEDAIVCNQPYIRFADTCCLDKNQNSICDGDEGLPTELPPEDEPETPDEQAPDEPTPDEPEEPEVPEELEEPVVDPCEGITCLATCDGTIRKFNGQCVEGECQYETQECEFGCVDGICGVDTCEGVTCPDFCDGTTRKFNGNCVDSACQYETEVCEFGCTEGACDADPCEGVSCPDTCDGTTRKHNGQCVAGECQYTTEECEFSCDAGTCGEGLFIFVTSSIGKGDLSAWTGAGGKTGIAAGDAVCNHLAGNAGLSAYFNAWLSNSTTNAKDRLLISDRPYYLVDGKKVADNKADLLDGSIAARIDVNEQNVPISGVTSVWTATSESGIKGKLHATTYALVEGDLDSLDVCDNWRDAVNGIALYGKTTSWDKGWTRGWNNYCNKEYHLYCFEDTPYYCEWSWPQKVIYVDTGEVVSACSSARPYCNRDAALEGYAQCCKKNGDYYDCVDVS